MNEEDMAKILIKDANLNYCQTPHYKNKNKH